MDNRTIEKFSTLCLALALCGVTAEACTGFYVGKRVSASGATMLCRTVDLPPTTLLFRMQARPRVENVAGRVHRGHFGFEWPLPATTYKYVCTPAAASGCIGDFASLGMNEKGLAVTATVTAYSCEGIRKADPFETKGLSEDFVTALLAASCANVREALALIGEIMAKVGGREGNVIMLADPTEAWYVETYSGHQWAAVKMPEDRVAAFGNEFGLRAFDPAAPDVMSSPDLVAMPERAGLLVKSDGAPIDLFRTYGGERHADFAHLRTWFGHKVLAGADAAGEYDREADLPLFFAPSRKVSQTDVFELMRCRYEGTEWCPDETRRIDVRPIGDEWQATCHVVEVRDDMPAPLACSAWACLGAAEHGVFLPLPSAATQVAADFARDSAPGACTNAYDGAMAAARFRRLAAFAEQDRVFYGKGVRDYWRACEERLVAEAPAVRAQAAKLYADSPERAAEYLTGYACAVQQAALDDARAMFDELAWYLTKGNITRQYSMNYHTHVMTPFEPRKPFAPTASRLKHLRFHEN